MKSSLLLRARVLLRVVRRSVPAARTILLPLLVKSVVAFARGTKDAYEQLLAIELSAGGPHASAGGKAVQGDGSSEPVAPRAASHPVMFNPGRHLIPEGLPSYRVRPGRDLPN